jgi:hypothetical protein
VASSCGAFGAADAAGADEDGVGVGSRADNRCRGCSANSANGYADDVVEWGSDVAAKRAARREAALASRPSLSPPGPAPERLRVATWNLNSLRTRLPAAERFLEWVRPDIVCLQETRAAHPLTRCVPVGVEGAREAALGAIDQGRSVFLGSAALEEITPVVG